MKSLVKKSSFINLSTSFKDSNGMKLVILRVDYRGSFSPDDYTSLRIGKRFGFLLQFSKSPNDDNGYDIFDYEDIMDEFGTMADMWPPIASR